MNSDLYTRAVHRRLEEKLDPKRLRRQAILVATVGALAGGVLGMVIGRLLCR